MLGLKLGGVDKSGALTVIFSESAIWRQVLPHFHAPGRSDFNYRGFESRNL